MLQAETGLIFWTAVSFLVLLFVLKKWALPPLMKILKERDEIIKTALKNSQESQQVAVKIVENAQNQAAAEKEKARAEIYAEKQRIQQEKSRLLEEARAEARQIVEEADLTLARHRAQVVGEIQEEVAGLIVETAKKFLRHRLTAKDQEELLAESLKELEKAYGEKRI